MDDDAQTPDLMARINERARQYVQDLPAKKVYDAAVKKVSSANDAVSDYADKAIARAKNIILPGQELPTTPGKRRIETDIELPKDRGRKKR